MSETIRKAERSEALRTSKIFDEFLCETIDEQTKIFQNADAKIEEISEAHAIIRALGKMKAKMAKAVNAAKHERHTQRKK
ncbi:hypothetical protein [Phaeobacter italicus]|uniref:hypothetical protein n=1 Tax=Phaeobacter italicus TaxID=481446 RepID=UPI001CD3EE81|nr:hypothetical protein [Phaeobacter italicus]MCA0856159.1 hypothetical protein [Phaeobacter italicus]